jgi:hypothetical protein
MRYRSERTYDENGTELTFKDSEIEKHNTKKTDLEKAVNSVMSRFDFTKVHGVMVFLDWKWGTQIPSIDQLKKEAHRQLTHCVSLFVKYNYPATGMVVASGGLCARIEYDGDRPDLSLLFYIEEKESNGAY